MRYPCLWGLAFLSAFVLGCAPVIHVGESVHVDGHTFIPLSATTRYLTGANVRNLYIVHKDDKGQVQVRDSGSATASGPLTAILPGGAAQAISLINPLVKPLPTVD